MSSLRYDGKWAKPPSSIVHVMTDPRGSMSREERDEFVPCYLASFRQSDLFPLPYYRAISRFKNMGGPKYMLISSWNFPFFRLSGSYSLHHRIKSGSVGLNLTCANRVCHGFLSEQTDKLTLSNAVIDYQVSSQDPSGSITLIYLLIASTSLGIWQLKIKLMIVLIVLGRRRPYMLKDSS